MTFGPFLLNRVYSDGDNLILELATPDGIPKYRPRRKLRYSHSEDAKRHAQGLVGRLVTTETYDPSKWPSTDWWLSVSAYDPDVPGVALKTETVKFFGPPGTGKTSKLIEIVKDFVKQGVQTEKIAFLTFTNAAGDVARARVIEAFPSKGLMDFPNFSTLHSLATRIGAMKGRGILDIERLRDYDPTVGVDEVWMKKGDPSSAEQRPEHTPLAINSFARARRIPLEEAVIQGNFPDFGTPLFDSTLKESLLRTTGRKFESSSIRLLNAYIQEYERFKTRERLADFDDVIENAQKPDFAPQLPSFDVLIVDEAQDLSDLQWSLVQKLIQKAKKTFVAGDDDQAIMVPFGASPTAFLKLSGEEIEPLKLSRRVPKSVYEYVWGTSVPVLKARFPDRKDKDWLPRDEVGEVCETILKTVRKETPDGEDTLDTVQAPIALPDLLKAIQQTSNSSWLVIAPTKATCQKASRGLEQLKIPHYHRNRPVLDPESVASDVRVMTVHTSKGDEADYVALLLGSIRDLEMLEADPRLRYVAHTRAKKCLYPSVLAAKLVS